MTLKIFEAIKGFPDTKNYFCKNLFSFNIENNLIYLNIEYMNQYIINPVSFERINKFKKLKYLYIKFFDFENIFVITLNTLKLLSINACKNVCLDSKIPYEILEVLEYNNTNNTIEYIFKNPNIYTFKNLIILNLSDNQLSKFDIDELGKVDCQKLEVLNLVIII